MDWYKGARLFLAGTAIAALSACGGSSAGSSLPSVANSSGSTGSGSTSGFAGSGSSSSSGAGGISTASSSKVGVSFHISTNALLSNSRQVKYISTSTQSVSIAVTQGSTTLPPVIVNCVNGSCSATVQAPVGTDTFVVNLYDAPNATGNVLSTGTTTASVLSGQANAVSLVFGGVPARLAVLLNPSTLPVGKSNTATVTVNAYDADGNLIVGPQNYATPISISDGDVSGATTLSTQAVASPASPITFSYNGSSAISRAIFTASAPGIASASATLAIGAPGSVPTIAMKHILTYQQHLKSTNPTSFGTNYAGIGAYVNYALTDPIANDGLRAGGIKTGFYSTVHTICISQTPGECVPDAVTGGVPENVYGHSCDGSTRISVSAPPSASNPTPLVQFQTDPGQPALLNVFNSVIDSNATSYGRAIKYDFVFDDNAGMIGDAFSWLNFYNYNTETPSPVKGYCGYSDSEYINGMKSIFNGAHLPVVANALDTPDNRPAASGAVQYFGGTPNLWGAMLEYAYGFNLFGTSRLKENGTIWQSQENTQLATSANHKLFVAYEHVGGTDAAGLDQRNYVYSSMMLAFDPTSAVMAQDGTTPASKVLVNPEEQLVPTNPLVAQPATVDGLRQSTGVYAREYAACYYNGNLVGPCAFVVNSDPNSSMSMPVLSRSYGHTGIISGSGVVPGVDDGTLSFNGPAAPSTVPPETSYMLFQ